MFANPSEYFASASDRYAKALELRDFARRSITNDRRWAYGEARAQLRAAKTAMRLCERAVAFEADPAKFHCA